MICHTLPTPDYLIIAEGLPNLLYYSHISSIVVSLIIGALVISNNPRGLLNRLLFSISFLFSIWVFFNLILWTNVDSNIVIFVWSFFGLLYGLISMLSVHFIYVFVEKKDVGFWHKLLFFLPILPIALFTSTKYNLSGFNLILCGSSGYEGIIFLNYYTLVGVFAMLWILTVLVKNYVRTNQVSRKQILLIGIGIEFFLFSFFITGFLASYLNEIGILEDYGIEQYGLFGMSVFMAFLAYLIVKFRAFNIKLIGAQALVISLIILISAQFLYAPSDTNKVLISFTLVIVGIIGLNLVRSVKKEIKLREEIEKQEKELEIANDQQTKLIHFITHQVKGFFTKSRNIFASVLEGDYGLFPQESKHILEEGLKSDTKAVDTVQEILNAANIRKGTLAFDMKPVDLKLILEKEVSKQKETAEHKGLVLETKINEGTYNLNGDESRLEHAIRNLIDNSIKYTPQGKINVELSRNEKEIILTVSDTGVGITQDDMKNLFREGGRGKDSVRVNVESTGYGLYIVKNIITTHKGTIKAESEGSGKGSKFVVEFPVDPNQQK